MKREGEAVVRLGKSFHVGAILGVLAGAPNAATAAESAKPFGIRVRVRPYGSFIRATTHDSSVTLEAPTKPLFPHLVRLACPTRHTDVTAEPCVTENAEVPTFFLE